jgi:hypothetical protein
LASNPAQRPPGLGKDGLTDLNRGATRPTRSEQDGEQFGTTQYTSTEVDEPLSRPL